MSRKSLDQERAAYAWKSVQGQSGDYKNLAKSLPALIMSNGLMQTFAFMKAKEKKRHHIILGDHVCEWVLPRVLPGSWQPWRPDRFKEDFGTIMSALHSASSGTYRRASEESLEILRWLRQLADAAIADGAGQE